MVCLFICKEYVARRAWPKIISNKLAYHDCRVERRHVDPLRLVNREVEQAGLLGCAHRTAAGLVVGAGAVVGRHVPACLTLLGAKVSRRPEVLVRCGAVWCGAMRCGAVWCGVVWCGVVWCGAVWCGAVWCVVRTRIGPTRPNCNS